MQQKTCAAFFGFEGFLTKGGLLDPILPRAFRMLYSLWMNDRVLVRIITKASEKEIKAKLVQACKVYNLSSDQIQRMCRIPIDIVGLADDNDRTKGDAVARRLQYDSTYQHVTHVAYGDANEDDFESMREAIRDADNPQPQIEMRGYKPQKPGAFFSSHGNGDKRIHDTFEITPNYPKYPNITRGSTLAYGFTGTFFAGGTAGFITDWRAASPPSSQLRIFATVLLGVALFLGYLIKIISEKEEEPAVEDVLIYSPAHLIGAFSALGIGSVYLSVGISLGILTTLNPIVPLLLVLGGCALIPSGIILLTDYSETIWPESAEPILLKYGALPSAPSL